ncbi:hypothetical protein [Colwellia psychrerythraea]|uniref:Uncharacterized protein n=1 Tax=Colwellia psychrerythraea TaxID=28229 RepID=A0A099KNP3_COLPS|nr:hypothetical protein [Colwellia psychrerythraea]KGJ91855.1 hypothetical protein GAB14E_3012 [Colwellia psychrerythraea]
MKSIKLLLISFTITLVALMTISPAIAKPSVKVQHLQLNNALTATHNNYNIIRAIGKVPTKLPVQYSNNFSSGLILSSRSILTARNANLAINVAKHTNEFFSSAMTVSDKLNQFMSYFSSPVKVKVSEQQELSPEGDILKEKCNGSINFS